MKIMNKIFFCVFVAVVSFSCNVKAEKTQISVARAYYELARQNNTQKIEALLHKGYPLSSVDSRGYNAVCISIVNQDKKAYKTLVSYGASKNPPCIQRIPDNVYHRFFGVYPNKTVVSPYTPDEPYLISAAVLGAGALTGAVLLISGSGGGGSGGSSDEDDGNSGGNDDNKDDEKEDEDPVQPNCPANSHYNQKTKKCECNVGYGNYGDNSQCYASIPHCTDQVKDVCKSCDSSYIYKDGKCYAPISNCKIQDGGECKECIGGYGVHSGDGTMCYINIEHCDVQNKDTCTTCGSGYGVHQGDGKICYENIPNCFVQFQTICKQCNSGYSTYGDPAANKCYKENPCDKYPNTVPINYGAECVCNANKGYSGEPGSCTREEEGEYQEGDGSKEEWNDLNAQYCNSHGKYSTENNLCLCYTGYINAKGSNIGCTKCDEQHGYIEVSGLCFKNQNCETRGKGWVQSGNSCVCGDGYYPINNENGQECKENITCEKHYEQYWDSNKGEMSCQCKSGFDENCDKCKNGFEYDESNDICIRTSYQCEEKWTGENCDICPSQYKITEDEYGVHCGLQCADNRADISSNPECNDCNIEAGYGYSEIYNNCIKDGCTSHEEGFIEINGFCTCDEANGYFMGISGKCELKGEDLIGNSTDNINNNIIELKNDGEFRDIYGMKSLTKDEDGNEVYFDDVYNAYANNGGEQIGKIDISNNASGNNFIYGIYSQSNIYNASVLNNAGESSAKALGDINITDTESLSDIYGIKNIGEGNTYNAFVHASGDKSKDEALENIAEGIITIKKPEVKGGKTSTGNIVGIDGNANIFNAYANSNGVGTNVSANGSINITHCGAEGSVIGIKGNSNEAKINNAYAFLNSAVSDVNAIGTINVSGNKEAYGIHSQGTVVNAESQFNKSYNVIGDFKSVGNINVSTKSSINSAYGIYIGGSSGIKTEVYNAMGYNSKGNISVTNLGGGNAYGIYSNAQTYTGTDEEDDKSYYNNVYNAFRSSAKYGGEDAATVGTVKVDISGNSSGSNNGVGIYSAGNVFNSFANSGSDVKLETIGNISINDSTTNSNVNIKGIEANGNLIANAYSKGSNLNTDTSVSGNIDIKITGNKSGGNGYVAGIYTSGGQNQEANIYNAALINDKNSVTGKIDINSEYNPISKIYGIYAVGSNDTDQPKTVYNAYYENDEAISEGQVKGEINIKNKEDDSTYGEYYGIYVKGVAGEYVAHNAYSSNINADVEGVINVDVVGGGNFNNTISAIAVGMYGDRASLYNQGKSTINVKTYNNNSVAYGMMGKNVNIYNDAIINVEVKNSSAYGLYADKGTVMNDVNGVINVTGEKDNYGIYALAGKTDDEAVKVTNLGKINLVGDGNNTGIYASGEKATVENKGQIIINGQSVGNISDNTPCTGENCPKNIAIKLENGASLMNDGLVKSDDSIDLQEIGGNVILNKNGKFISEKDIGGDLQISQNTVIDSFDKETTLQSAIVAKNIDDLNIKSNSYMYDTQIKENNNNEYDVVMKMKDFSNISEEEKAEYYTLNYNQENNIELFNALKSATTLSEVKQIDADITATSVLPNITQENMKVMRSLDTKMMSDLFKGGNQDVRKIVGADAMFIGRDDHGTLTGYDINSQSMYALYDKKIDNKYRLGLGLSFTHSDTDYNNDSTRKNFMVQGYIPLTYTNSRGLTAVSMARLGYSDGDYTRIGHNESYKADTNEITYGLLNELRYSVNLGGITFTPFVGLNATGWYQNSIDEGDSNLAVNIDSANIFSLESALGIYVDKDIEFNDNSKLSVLFGAGYYHEFADPYKGIDASINNTIGHYKLRDIENINSRDRGMLSAKVNYDYKDFSIYGELMQYLEKEYPLKLDVGLKYKF